MIPNRFLLWITALLLFTFFIPSIGSAAPYYGINVSSPLVDKDPSYLNGYQLMLSYDPQRFKWRKFNVYFDGGFSHFWTNTPHNSTISIYSIAPVIRYTFRKRGPVFPFLEISIGLAYLNHTRIEQRNLGIHFSFQDRMGIGAFIGKSKQFSLGIHAVHYSNACFSEHNSGISIPMVLDVGYRFS